MSQRETDLFEQDILALLADSLHGEPTKPHLDEEVLISIAAGELPSGARASVDAHLVACRQCTKRLADLREGLQSDEEALAALASIESQTGQVDAPAWRLRWSQISDRHLRRWIGSVSRVRGRRRTLRRTMEVLGAVAIVAIGVLIAWLAGGLQFGARPVADVLQARGSSEAHVELSAALDQSTLQQMIDDLSRIESYPTWRAIAYGVGLLNRYGVPLDAPGLTFEGATVHLVRPGDTWTSIAEEKLGDGDLWPILVLLNQEIAEELSEELIVGTVVRVPLLHQEGESSP